MSVSNFTKRLVFGALYIGVLGFGILYNESTYIGLFFILMLLSLYEFTKMLKAKCGAVYLISALFFITLVFVTKYEFQYPQQALYLKIALFISFFLPFISTLFFVKEDVVKTISEAYLSIAYIAIPFTLLALLSFLGESFEQIKWVVLGILVLIWTNDSFAYLVGKNLGKTKLLERISPNKTIEGFFGGMFFTFVLSYFIAKYSYLSITNWLIIALLVSVFGVVGDLIESMFKRSKGVKDSSNFIPGHGGFLDRLDSLIFVAPFVFVYLLIVG